MTDSHSESLIRASSPIAPSTSWILASGSPRRRSLLRQLGLPFSVKPSRVDERIHLGESPHDFALRMAVEKALDVAYRVSQPSQGTDVLVVGGDTVVALGSQALGKPTDESHAVQMLSELSGRAHDVWSGWAVARVVADQAPQVICSGVSRGVVHMREISPSEREVYIRSGEPMDKAGSYGIQGAGGRFVEKLSGSLYGVIGIPIADLTEALVAQDLIPSPDFARRSISLRERVATAAWRSGRAVDEVQVLAVSKHHPAERLFLAGAHDFKHFGESYLQELSAKRPQVEGAWTEVTTLQGSSGSISSAPTWHYIGKIQTNKARHIGASVDWVHGVSRESEARRLAEGAAQAGHTLQVCLQVNVAGEEQKGGVSPDQVAPLLERCRAYDALNVVGLMTFPPLGSSEESRAHFRALRHLRDELASTHGALPHLSMGTSHDFEVAVEEGATWVRLGRALFGERA